MLFIDLCTVSVNLILGENKPCMAISTVYMGKHKVESSGVGTTVLCVYVWLSNHVNRCVSAVEVS